MPQSSPWYEDYKRRKGISDAAQPSQPTPTSGSQWYEDYKRRKGITDTPNTPPSLEGGGIMDTLGGYASGAYDRLKEVGKSIYGMTPLGQTSSAQSALDQVRSNPEPFRKATAQLGTDLNTELSNPYSVAQTATGLVDPTGTVPGYMALGRSAVGNIRDQNYGGLATDVGLAAAPWAIGKGLSRLTRGIKPELLPKEPAVDVVPPVDSIQKLQAQVRNTSPMSVNPSRSSVRRGLTAEAQDAVQTPVRDGIFGPQDLTNETALLEQSRLRPQSRWVNPGTGDKVKPPPVVPPVRQLTEFAGVDPRTAEGQAETISRRQAGQRLMLPAPTPPIENPGTARFIGAPGGQVADAFDPSSAEALEGLGLQRPGTTNPLRDRGVELPRVAPPEPWDFDSLGTRQVEEPYNTPRSQGVQSVTSTGKAKGEVTGRPAGAKPTKSVKVKYVDELGRKRTRTIKVPEDASEEVIQAIKNKVIKGGNGAADYLDDGDMLYATVPNRLRPEAPNVARLRGMAEGYGKQGAKVAEEGIEIIDEAEWERRNWGKPAKTVEGGEGLTARPRNPRFGPVKEVMQESAPVKGSIDRWKAVPLSEAPPRIPVKTPSFESGSGSIDRNKLTPIQNKPLKVLAQEAADAEKAYQAEAIVKRDKWLEKYKADSEKRKAREIASRQKWQEAQQKKEARRLGLDRKKTVAERMAEGDPDITVDKKKTAADLIAEKEKKIDERDKSLTFAQRLRKTPGYEAVYRPIAVSGSQELRNMGKGGSELADVLEGEATESTRHAGNQHVKIAQVSRELNKKEQLEVAEIMAGKKPLTSASNEKVREAYKFLREGTEEAGDEAITSNVRMKTPDGRNVAFEKHKGEYWPQFHDEALYKDLDKLEVKLLKAGNSPVTVKAMIKRIKEQGERFTPGQHTRELNVEGYDMSLKALEKYHTNMSRAITRAKRFGPMDVADENSIISKMIKNAEDPERAKSIVLDYLNRTDHASDAQKKVYKAATKWTAVTKLSKQAITNTNDLAGAATILGPAKTTKALFKILRNPRATADYATKTGALSTIREGLLKEGGGGRFAKWTGANSTEQLVRTVEAVAGRDHVQSLFNKAKKDSRWAKPLAKFVDGNVDDILKQKSLTEQQLEFASTRAVEKVSGVPNRLSLSEGFYSNNPLMRVPALLKRFAFINTKNIVNAIKESPTPTAKATKIVTAMLAYQGMGELTGDAKAAIDGLVTGDVEKAINERGENTVGTGNAAFDRIFANYMQASLFGLPGELSESIARKSQGKVTGTLGGPLGADADEALSAAFSKDKARAFGKAAVRRIPVIGTGLAQKFFPKEEGGSSPFGNLGKPSGFGR